MNYIKMFRESAAAHGNSIALVSPDGCISYAELDKLSSQVAGKLASLGIGRGDFVMLCFPRTHLYIAAFLGALMAGAAVVPVVPEYPKDRIDTIISDCGAKLVIDPAFMADADSFVPLFAPAGDTEPALAVYTSGSTGRPKGIIISTGDLYRASRRSSVLFDGVSPIIYAASAPFSFAATILEYMTTLSLGATVHIMPDDVRKSADGLRGFFRSHGITAAWCVPSMLRVMLGDEMPESLQCIISGGERMSNIKPQRFFIRNSYGMSESAAGATTFDLDAEYSNTPIGKALPGVEIRICDGDGNELPDGTEGEIRVVGEYDTYYFADPERSARTFVKLPDGRTSIRSGDRGYKNESGDVVFVSREDWMVKINGQRVETLEIEAKLTEADGIAAAAVKAFTDDDGQTYIAAYYVPSGDGCSYADGELRGILMQSLPEYMIPKYFVRMDALPRNLNGKLDRKALLPPDTEKYKAEYAAPETDAEKVLCLSFERVLHCGKVGINDDFFALGGDSIKVLRLIADAGIPALTPADILSLRTPKLIAREMKDGGKRIAHTDKIAGVTPLTDAQRGVYLECIAEPDSTMYNIPFACRLPDGTDEGRFISAVKTAAAKHRVLFVTVSAPDGVPSMIYPGCADAEVEIIEADDISSACREFVRPFDLENGPLYRFALCRTDGGSALLADVHHIIFDGTSLGALVSEIAAVYAGKEADDEKLTQFDIAASEAGIAETDEYKAALRYFDAKLGGTDVDSRLIPDVLTADEITGDRGGSITVAADGIFTGDEVGKFAKRHKITENTLFLGAFAYTLAKLNGTADCSFCSVDNGRHDARLSGSVGMFVKTLPLYYNIDESMTAADFLAGVQSDFHETMRHDCVSFAELSAKYGVSTSTVFIYQAELFSGAELDCGMMRVDPIDTGDCQADIDFMVINTPSGYKLTVHYRRTLYTERFAASAAELYLHVVSEMMRADTLAGISLVSDGARRRLDAFNHTDADYDRETTLVDLFRRQAKKTPDNLCVVAGDVKLTYRETDEITDKIASKLASLGIGRGDTVGVLIERSEYMVTASMAVLKTCAAYMPLDPSYPAERLNLMMKDSGAKLLICSPALSRVIDGSFTGVRLTTDELDTIGKDGEIRALPSPTKDDSFVLLYTSGSTGVPKGVIFRHSNALVTAVWVRKYFGMDGTSHVTSYASYGFDAHVFDIYPPLTVGAEVHIIKDDIRLDFIRLKEYFDNRGITHTVMTTQIGRQFALMAPFRTLAHLSVAGEKLTPVDVPAGLSMYNLYGPTEGSVITSAFRIDGRYNDVPIGMPVDNLKLHVVDKAGRLLPAGAVGELWISGAHVTAGYLNRPEKTAEAYGENPFSSEPGYERVYKTGDIVRLNADGNLQFIGRRDAQVKVRGFRVELTEIEEVIRRFPAVKDATVAAFDDPAGGKFIAAYVVSDEAVDFSAVGEFIKAEKPPYMVPAVFMQIDKIPLTQNQKVNRRALPVPVRESAEMTAPETEMQKSVFAVVAETVGHDAFGIDSDLYEIGLTSIGAVKLNVALAKAFGISVKISDIKANPTVRRLDAFIRSAKPETEYEIRDYYPITETQKGIFVESIARPDTTVYNIPLLIRLGESVDTARLEAAVKTALDAHPYVKVTLESDGNGEITARRNDSAEITVTRMSADELPSAGTLVLPFTLIGEPLYRIEIIKTPQANYLFMDFHHIICDGTSENVMLSDISLAYAGEAVEKETFTGYEIALDEEAGMTGGRLAEAEKYYASLLSGCEPSVPMKTPEGKTDKAGRTTFTAVNQSSALLGYCRKNGVTPNAFFSSVFALVLGKYAGKDDVTFATIYNGRSDSRMARSVSMLVKTLPVAVSLRSDDSLKAFVCAVQKQIEDSMANDICPFSRLHSEYGVTSDVIFAYQGDDFAFGSLCGGAAEYIPLMSETAKAPLSVNVYLDGEDVVYDIEYRCDFYSGAFASAFADAFASAVCSAVTANKLGEVSLMSPRAEKIYDEMNATDCEFGSETVIDMIERLAAANPDRSALSCVGETLTFGEMNEAANKIAHVLMKHGVGRDRIAAIVLERSCMIPTAEIGIMKAGGAFLAILPDYPDDRIRFCIADAACPCVITSADIMASRSDLFSSLGCTVLTVEDILASCEKTDNPSVPLAMDSLAYTIYTSGSTGTPKGVMIGHRNLANVIKAHIAEIPFLTRDGGTALASCSVSFDASVLDSFLPLAAGKHLVICTDAEHLNPLMMRDVMVNNKIDFMVSTPSYLTNLTSIRELDPAFANLKAIIVGAEAFPAVLYESLRRTSPEMQIINGYGPSECAVCCSVKEIRRADNITIGRPIKNTKLFVMDKEGRILPPYAVGELIIAGDCVGRGYVNLPEKTAAAYFTMNGEKAYHSGDLVRLNGDGEIEFGGRIDNQIKLRGFRIELDEIENVMTEYPAVRQSKVIVRNNGSEDCLAAYFTADSAVDLADLTAFMKTKLTYYMIPAAMMQLDAMPLTQNGKIDKKALPEIKQAERKRTERRKPRRSTEEELCELFGSVLSIPEYYADDNFFEMGGTSLTASKVTMQLMSKGIKVEYQNIFDNPTPEMLADYIASLGKADAPKDGESGDDGLTDGGIAELLKYNSLEYAAEVTREPLGDVLLTGAVGFLGIHVLNELLEKNEGRVICLIKRDGDISPEIRLRTMYMYYFGEMHPKLGEIEVIDCDITDDALEDRLASVDFDCLINCAACVKHYAADDVIEKINVHGVENLIRLAKAKGARMIQISTTSVPGVHTDETYRKQIKMHENELFVIDSLDNKYGISKYRAEMKMLAAIRDGLDGKIIRVGNLMGRHSDGEFQINFTTNAFLSALRGFATIGKCPISHATDPMSFSPIDMTAKAIVLLSGTNAKFTAFHANNRFGFDEMQLIDSVNRCGITVTPVPDGEYYADYYRMLGDEKVNSRLSGLMTNDRPDLHAVDVDNVFTANVLYRLGFSWPLTEGAYLDRAIESLITLDYFESDGGDEI